MTSTFPKRNMGNLTNVKNAIRIIKTEKPSGIIYKVLTLLKKNTNVTNVDLVPKPPQLWAAMFTGATRILPFRIELNIS
jgi:hypothetical protein